MASKLVQENAGEKRHVKVYIEIWPVFAQKGMYLYLTLKHKIQEQKAVDDLYNQ